jgi:hypothetical protein
MVDIYVKSTLFFYVVGWVHSMYERDWVSSILGGVMIIWALKLLGY